VPVPRHCPNPGCTNYHAPRRGWFYHHGSYETVAHGTVTRYRCKQCGRTCSSQTESIFYYTKRRLNLPIVYSRLRGGSSLRDIARSFGVSRTAVTTSLFRLGRQAIAAHALLTQGVGFSQFVAFDGLLSFVTSQDFPCHLTTSVDSTSEFIFTMTHAIVRRGGTLTPKQRRRLREKERVWRPKKGALTRAISLLIRELVSSYDGWRSGLPMICDTDEHPLYRTLLKRDIGFGFFKRHDLARHRLTSSRAARTPTNPLFPVNLVDMLLRHRMKEHTRETIAFGRHAVHQMHRAWIFAYDHNYGQPWRVKAGDLSKRRAAVLGIAEAATRRATREFFSRRIDLRGVLVADSMVQVWLGKMESPPVRWRQGQREARKVRVPKFAIRDLSAFPQFR